MGRLYELMLADPPRDLHPYETHERLASVINVDIENVARYLKGQTDSEGDPYQDWEFPNCVPPWRAAFFEYKTWPFCLGQIDPTDCKGWAVLGLAYDKREYPEENLLITQGDEENRWLIFFSMWRRSKRCWSPRTDCAIRVREDGALWRDGNTGRTLIAAPEDPEGYIAELDPVLLAFSFAHCKNVELRRIEPDPKRVRAARRRGRPLRAYHVLEIDPMRRVLRDEGGAESGGLQQALHICRGHFKDYRESGLFGSEKHKGVYWWPQHLRGNAKEGVVEKGYSVKAP
jgi:hypothetical protein